MRTSSPQEFAGGVIAIVFLCILATQLPTEKEINASQNKESNVSQDEEDNVSQTAVMWLLASAPLLWAAGYGIMAMIAIRSVDEFKIAVQEGFLWPTSLVFVGFACFAVMGYFIVNDPSSMLHSLQRLPYVGTTEYEFEILGQWRHRNARRHCNRYSVFGKRNSEDQVLCDSTARYLR